MFIFNHFNMRASKSSFYTKLSEQEQKRLIKLFAILIEIDKKKNITGYFSKPKNVRYNKNKHKKGYCNKTN